MARLSKILFAATLIAAPTAVFAADGDPPADGTAGGGGDGTAGGAPAGGDGTAPATGDGSMAPAGDGGMATWSKSVIDRPLTVMKGKLGVGVDLAIAHISISILGTTSSSTSEGLLLSGAYGVTDKIEVGASYGFSLHEFEIKGTLTPFAAISLVHSDKLDVAAGLDIAVDLNSPDPSSTTGETTTTETLEAGLGVRYKITPKIAAFTGSPFPGGPVGQHLKIGFQEGASKTFDIPVGFGMQATPELFAYLTTNVATILLSDVPMGGKRVQSIADATPLSLGGWFNVNKNIDAVATLSFFDVQHAGDAYAIFLGARYFN